MQKVSNQFGIILQKLQSEFPICFRCHYYILLIIKKWKKLVDTEKVFELSLQMPWTTCRSLHTFLQFLALISHTYGTMFIIMFITMFVLVMFVNKIEIQVYYQCIKVRQRTARYPFAHYLHTCCFFFMLHSFHVTLFAYCIISMLHFFV